MNYLFSRGKLIDNPINNDEDTPLHFAANSFNKRAALILVFNGADINKANTKGEVPGDGGKIEMKMFNRKVFSEKACFKSLANY